jgi:hypothetical protein
VPLNLSRGAIEVHQLTKTSVGIWSQESMTWIEEPAAQIESELLVLVIRWSQSWVCKVGFTWVFLQVHGPRWYPRQVQGHTHAICKLMDLDGTRRQVHGCTYAICKFKDLDGTSWQVWGPLVCFTLLKPLHLLIWSIYWDREGARWHLTLMAEALWD